MNSRESRAAGQTQETGSGADSGHVLDTPDMLHRNGLSALIAARHDEAINWISRAIRADPKPLYLTSLGTALLAQGRREEALAVFDKAVQLKPDDAGLWCNLGLALAEAGRIADAIRGLQHALTLDRLHSMPRTRPRSCCIRRRALRRRCTILISATRSGPIISRPITCARRPCRS